MEEYNMTTREINDTLRYMSVEDMGAPEGVVVSRAVWEYGALAEGDEKEELKKVIADKAAQMKDKTASVEGCEYPSAMNLLYTAYNVTGDETYKNVITELEKSDKYMGLAFDMHYETMFGGKEHYHALTVKFAELKKNNRENEMQEALFMLALVDTIAAIAEPVYELYRSLVDMFRDELGVLIDRAWERDGRMRKHISGEHVNIMDNTDAQAVMAFAVKKACALKVVLAEKYLVYTE